MNEIGLPAELRRCLCTTNIVESPFSGVRSRTDRVGRWRDGTMALRWAATAMLEGEKRYRRILGYNHLWILKSFLDGSNTDGKSVAEGRKAG